MVRQTTNEIEPEPFDMFGYMGKLVTVIAAILKYLGVELLVYVSQWLHVWSAARRRGHPGAANVSGAGARAAGGAL